MENTVIDNLYSDSRDLVEYLNNKNEISLKNTAENIFRKTLVLSIGSFFEFWLVDIIKNYASKKTSNDNILVSFIENKALKRQYHTLFQWEKNNVNSFLRLFGLDFLESSKSEIENDEYLQDSVNKFMEIGRLRNQLTHQNIADFPLNKTAEEIYQSYKIAINFVNFIQDKFNK